MPLPFRSRAMDPTIHTSIPTIPRRPRAPDRRRPRSKSCACSTASIDPELHADIVELGMVDDIKVGSDGAVTVKVALTTAGLPAADPDQTGRRVEGPRLARCHRRLRRVRRDDRRAEARPPCSAHAGTHARTRRHRGPLHHRASSRSRAGRVASASRRSPSTSPSRSPRRAARSACSTPTSGASACRGCSASKAGSAAPTARSTPNMVEVPNPDDPAGPAGTVKVVSMGFLVDDESTALMWRGLILTKALEQFLTDVRWGEIDYLLIDMPPGHRRHPDGPGPACFRRPRCSSSPRRRSRRRRSRCASPTWPAAAYVKIVGVVENMSEFVPPDGSRHPVFGRGGGEALARRDRRAARRPHPARAGGVAKAATPAGRSCSSTPDSAAGVEFRRLADRIVDELLPPIEMSGARPVSSTDRGRRSRRRQRTGRRTPGPVHVVDHGYLT